MKKYKLTIEFKVGEDENRCNRCPLINYAGDECQLQYQKGFINSSEMLEKCPLELVESEVEL